MYHVSSQGVDEHMINVISSSSSSNNIVVHVDGEPDL